MHRLSSTLQQPGGCRSQNKRGRWHSQQSSMQLWVEKHSPKSLADLAVHSKKVAEVRAWLEAQLHNALGPYSGSCSVLLLTGPAGVGKTAVVRVLAEVLSLELLEWDAPVPTLWREHLHHSSSGTYYLSKLQEFRAFLESAKKYPVLPVRSLPQQGTDEFSAQDKGIAKRPKVLLLDDLPAIHGRESISQLCQCLHSFAISVQYPTIVVITEFLENGENGQELTWVSMEIQKALESGGASKITFNPITVNVLKKILTKISAVEKCSMPQEYVLGIAESCGGDIRHAICSLQFLCLGRQSIWDAGTIRDGLPQQKNQEFIDISKQDLLSSLPSIAAHASQGKHKTSMALRDGVLSLFHALGKLLYNKRCTDETLDTGKGINLILKGELTRNPFNMEEPETILSQAHIEAGVFSSFLHENLLAFIDDEAIEDAALAVSYLSEADCLLGARRKHSRGGNHFTLLDANEIDSRNLAETSAGSLAARGVLFANTHPAPRRWQSLRAPVLRQVERSQNENRVGLLAQRWAGGLEYLSAVATSTQATEYQPYVKQILVLSSVDASHVMFPLSYAGNDHSMALGTFETHEVESEVVMPMYEEQQLSTAVRRSMDIDRRMDATFSGMQGDCEDDIEEW